MIIISIKSAERLHGHAIIQPRDESCWIVKNPEGKYTNMFLTRREARQFVKNHVKKSMPVPQD
jgi:hypothetical protein